MKAAKSQTRFIPSVQKSLSWTKKEILICAILIFIFSPFADIAITAGVRAFLFSPFQLEGPAMHKTIQHGEYVVVDKIAYRFKEPQRGDIVLHRSPHENHKWYIRRIIGMPDEKLILKNGFVFVKEGNKEVQLDELYLSENARGKTYQGQPAYEKLSFISYDIPPDNYFLMGDNRQESFDSRSITDAEGNPSPYIPRSAIIGKVSKNFHEQKLNAGFNHLH